MAIYHRTLPNFVPNQDHDAVACTGRALELNDFEHVIRRGWTPQPPFPPSNVQFIQALRQSLLGLHLEEEVGIPSLCEMYSFLERTNIVNFLNGNFAHLGDHFVQHVCNANHVNEAVGNVILHMVSAFTSQKYQLAVCFSQNLDNSGFYVRYNPVQNQKTQGDPRTVWLFNDNWEILAQTVNGATSGATKQASNWYAFGPPQRVLDPQSGLPSHGSSTSLTETHGRHLKGRRGVFLKGNAADCSINSLDTSIRSNPDAIIEQRPDKIAGEILLWLLSKQGGRLTQVALHKKLAKVLKQRNQQLPRDQHFAIPERSTITQRKKKAIMDRRNNGSTYQDEHDRFEATERFNPSGKRQPRRLPNVTPKKFRRSTESSPSFDELSDFDESPYGGQGNANQSSSRDLEALRQYGDFPSNAQAPEPDCSSDDSGDVSSQEPATRHPNKGLRATNGPSSLARPHAIHNGMPPQYTAWNTSLYKVASHHMRQTLARPESTGPGIHPSPSFFGGYSKASGLSSSNQMNNATDVPDEREARATAHDQAIEGDGKGQYIPVRHAQPFSPRRGPPENWEQYFNFLDELSD